jgi:hypothetical protein
MIIEDYNNLGPEFEYVSPRFMLKQALIRGMFASSITEEFEDKQAFIQPSVT